MVAYLFLIFSLAVVIGICLPVGEEFLSGCLPATFSLPSIYLVLDVMWLLSSCLGVAVIAPQDCLAVVCFCFLCHMCFARAQGPKCSLVLLVLLK